MNAWVLVGLVGVATALLKGAGPVLIGGRQLPARLQGVAALFGPAMLAALVVSQTLVDAQQLVVDERAVGVAVAAVALWRRGSLLVAVVLGVATTALFRASL